MGRTYQKLVNLLQHQNKIYSFVPSLPFHCCKHCHNRAHHFLWIQAEFYYWELQMMRGCRGKLGDWVLESAWGSQLVKEDEHWHLSKSLHRPNHLWSLNRRRRLQLLICWLDNSGIDIFWLFFLVVLISGGILIAHFVVRWGVLLVYTYSNSVTHLVLCLHNHCHVVTRLSFFTPWSSILYWIFYPVVLPRFINDL